MCSTRAARWGSPRPALPTPSATAHRRDRAEICRVRSRASAAARATRQPRGGPRQCLPYDPRARRRRRHSRPAHFGDWPLPTCAASIDWTPFFRAWELAGNYPAILDDSVVGESARELFDDAMRCSTGSSPSAGLRRAATVGLWRCGREGDDVLILAGTTGPLPFLRQQGRSAMGGPTCALPTSSIPEGEIGSAASRSASTGIEPHLQPFKRGERRLFGDPAQGARGPTGRGFAERSPRRKSATGCGAMPRRASLQRAADPREYPASARPRLSRLPRPFLQANPVRPTRRRARGRRPDRKFCDAADFGGLGLLLRPPRSQYFGVARIGQDQLEEYARRRAVESNARRAGCGRISTERLRPYASPCSVAARGGARRPCIRNPRRHRRPGAWLGNGAIQPVERHR